MAAALTEDLLEEVLVRIPPEDPASLVGAALVSKRWCRLVCGRRFRRRFREFHGAPPLLGLVCRGNSTSSFLHMSSFHRRDSADRRGLRALHSCHGRVLLYFAPLRAAVGPSGLRALHSCHALQDLFVWDPITDKLRKLPQWPLYESWGTGSAAVLCAGAVVVGDGCNHLDCHNGPFMVVFVGIEYGRTFICTYSSEADRWSEPAYADHCYYHGFEKGNSVLVGSAVYFKSRDMSLGRPAMLKYDLLTRQSSPIHIPIDGPLKGMDDHEQQKILLTSMEGRLGFAFIRLMITDQEDLDSKLHLWSMEHGPDDDAIWVQSKVMDLGTLLQADINTAWTYVVAAFADSGSGVIFLSSDDGLFSLDLKSESCKMVGRNFGCSHVVSYMSFCTPALGAVGKACVSRRRLYR